MSTSLTNILFILIIFQLAFLCFFLFTQQKGRRISNKLLGFFFLAICLNLLDVFLLNTGVYFVYPFLAGFGTCMFLVLGPLLYFYTKSVIYKDFTVTSKNLLHFLPFVIFFLGTEFYYLSQPRDVQELILKRLAEHHIHKVFSITSALIFLQFMVYMILSLRLIASYKKATNQLFSNAKHTNVSWLYSTIIFFIAVMLVTTLNGLLTQTALAKYYLAGFNLVILAVLIFVIGVLMKALQGSYFSFTEDKELTAKNPSSKNTEAEDIEKENAVNAIIQYMKSDKPYLEPELTLDGLASQLAMKPKFLSLVINEKLEQNFFDFINRYRIDDAAKMLTNPEDEKITILEVLYKVGFNSKSSFNTLFKKYTGLTPTEFKRKKSR